MVMEVMKYSIDRFEGDFAVCENLKDDKMLNIHKSHLPEGCREGDILKYENGTYIIDYAETQNAKNAISTLANKLFKK